MRRVKAIHFLQGVCFLGEKRPEWALGVLDRLLWMPMIIRLLTVVGPMRGG